jgi:hypothetical protein
MLNASVTSIALVLAVVSFALYVYQAVYILRNKPTAPAASLAEQTSKTLEIQPFSAEQLAKLIDSLAKLTDSLAKAGPPLTSLVASIVFLVIASISAPSSSNCAPGKSSSFGVTHFALAAQENADRSR